MLKMAMMALVIGGAAGGGVTAAQAQQSITACESQPALEQVWNSNGQIRPDGCRDVTLSVLESDGERLCLLDLRSSEGGLLNELREVAVSEEWWVRCADIAAAAR
jgi:hypothetical protein